MSHKLKRVALMVALPILLGLGSNAWAGNCKKPGEVREKGRCVLKETVVKKAAVNGVCGSNATTHAADVKDWATSGRFCAAGTLSTATVLYPQPGGEAPWTCLGEHGGTNASCKGVRLAALPAPTTTSSATARLTVASQASRVRSHMMSSRVSVPGLPSVVVPVCGGVVGITGTSAVNFESSALTSGAPINAKP